MHYRNLELHVTHACNLSCEGCAHYSDQGQTGRLDFYQAAEWLAHWGPRVRVRQFSLLGGEPTLHPQLWQFVWLAHECFPRARRVMATNGLRLISHGTTLPQALYETKTKLIVSIHGTTPEYNASLEEIRATVADWRKSYPFDVQWRPSVSQWTRRYHGRGPDMRPYNTGCPRRAWRRCCARFCGQIHEGKIWKCAALAYFGQQDRRHDLGPDWQPFRDYRPLDRTDDQATIDTFFAAARKPEPCCACCPTRLEKFEPGDPTRTSKP